jgi:hypothetical protein
MSTNSIEIPMRILLNYYLNIDFNPQKFYSPECQFLI